MNPRDVLFEFFRQGAYVKVSAMDPETLTEVSIVGPANSPTQILKSTALRKLQYVIQKNREKQK